MRRWLQRSNQIIKAALQSKKDNSLTFKLTQPMKKIIAIILFAAFSTVAFTSCTDEEIAPKKESNNQGGSPIKEG